ncbi:MAG: hypothetical protein A2161_06345 [Candidatus Schekmanbacteria bacterium RBG_13_48_7]|uniref:HD-GYP domain-containing protein n=1 Tax=Candidatus Schekmanbacteria bacterium RBG_13_48_7 TaxID=1817878 RepID=A0A1F7S2R0_9BACT|nr:MAG: hypothetical protein A2161_06345 [Candidatus Schekmanbacteria bacterium RBG_13_48_7]
MSTAENLYQIFPDETESQPDSFEQYHQMYLNSPDAIVILDQNLKIMEANPAFERITEFSSKEIIGELVTGIAARPIAQEQLESIKFKALSANGWKAQIISRKKSGKFWNCHLALSALKPCEGSKSGYIGIIRDITQLTFRNLKGISSTDAIKNTQFSLVYGLAKLAECRDPETGYHLERVEGYCAIIAEALKSRPKYERLISREFIETIASSSPLHDIGKVGIPDSILKKKGPLTKEEFSVMKHHSVIGGDVLKGSEEHSSSEGNLIMARTIAYEHHERYDGSGYPFRLKGDQISLPARIVALVDAYDCITSKRVYKEAESHEVAVEKIRIDSNKHFDPDIVDAFLEAETEILRIKGKYPNVNVNPDTKFLKFNEDRYK